MASAVSAIVQFDLGKYPLANGQLYGGGETSELDQMPVEECGNMLILMAALAKVNGNANIAAKYWHLAEKWAKYLLDRGLDPSNQLSTDDFTGHLAHNTNLSLKAIIGLRCYAYLCSLTGKKEEAKRHSKAAQEMATQWEKMANDGDHYRLAFDKPDTWSLKYNLVWDEFLDFNIFSKTIAEKEIAYYKTKSNRYGVPLDNRSAFTKLDWTLWVAALTTNREDFLFFTDPVHKFLHETEDRVPMSDWYWTTDARMRGFQARSVVGGVYMPMLLDEEILRKWKIHAAPPADKD